MSKLSRDAISALENQQRDLKSQPAFNQYALQGQMRDRVFQSALLNFKAQMKRLPILAKRRQAGLEWYLKEMQELRSQFDTHIKSLRKQGVIEFTMPMELALASVRTQWFLQYQGPQIRLGWQQANQGFQGLYKSDQEK